VTSTDGAAPGPRLEIDVLGPLRVRVDGVPVPVPGPRRRSLLAVLTLARGRAVGVDTLVEALWPEDAPDTGREALQSQVSRLRRSLGPAGGRLRRGPDGYRLDLGPDESDVSRARRLVDVAHRPDGAGAAGSEDAVRTALQLWRGPALEEFADLPALQPDRIQLAELHRRLREEALESRLGAGDDGVTAEAAAAVREDPLRERAVLLWVRALAAEGRTAEAMRAAAVYRRRLADETGLDPGPELGALEADVASGALARPASRGGRPARPTGPLVGRGRERAELHRLLAEHAVVTVTGPGGVGKTRLTTDVAADLGERGRDVALVRLAAVPDPVRVPEAVASTLGLRTTSGTTPDAVAEALAGRSLVLVLDNCEHVTAVCSDLVSALRTRAPGVCVLATSRRTLQATDEYVLRLEPLPVPCEVSTPEELARQPSVQAFVEHARRRGRGIDLRRVDAADVVEVLRRLDGLPLAIELAAGCLAVLPLAALRDRLGRVLDLLSSDRPSDEARHRTLRTTIAWSYRLVSPADQALLRALAAFPGGLDLAAIEELARETQPGDDPIVVVARLVDASLLAVQHEPSARYQLLETVRAFLQDELVASGEQPEAEDRFLRWARRTARELGEALRGEDEPAGDRRLRAELANLRAARDLARRREDVDCLVELTLALDEPSVWRDLQELWAWSTELAEDPAVRGRPEEVAVLGGAAEAAWLQGSLQRARELASRGLELAGHRPGGSAHDSARCWSALAAVALFAADFGTSRWAWTEGGALDDRPAGQLAGAALAAGYAGDGAGARQLLDRALRAEAAAPWPAHRAFARYVAGELAAAEDPYAAAAEYTAAVQEARRCGATFVDGVATVGLASVWTATGKVQQAARGYRALMEYWLRTGNRTQLWTTVRNVATLLADHGRRRPAAALYGAADAAESAATLAPEVAERACAARSALVEGFGPAEVDRIAAEAAAMSVADVVRLAGEELAALTGQAAAGIPPGR
jgi:predicted ATPase/DNA-binding SARP family transcriptional activator